MKDSQQAQDAYDELKKTEGVKRIAFISEVEVEIVIAEEDTIKPFIVYVDPVAIKNGLQLDTIAARCVNLMRVKGEGVTAQDSLNISRSMAVMVDAGVKDKMRAAEYRFAA